jgi:uncharacterized protein YqjF (DUF2071 family)
MFLAEWCEALFVHFRVGARNLQPAVPFQLDTFEDGTYLSLVAFTQTRLRFARGGRVAAWLATPLAEHEFLNLRSYVRVNGEPGIHFIAEWIPNRLAALIGPRTYGLPYRLAALQYRHLPRLGIHECRVRASGKNVTVVAEVDESAVPSACRPGSLDEFLLERYTAFTCLNGVVRRFRVDHVPWPQHPVKVRRLTVELARTVLPWLTEDQFAGANYSAGVCDVAISTPTILNRQTVGGLPRSAGAFPDMRRESAHRPVGRA